MDDFEVDKKLFVERFHAKTPNGRGSKKIDLDEIAFFL